MALTIFCHWLDNRFLFSKNINLWVREAVNYAYLFTNNIFNNLYNFHVFEFHIDIDFHIDFHI